LLRFRSSDGSKVLTIFLAFLLFSITCCSSTTASAAPFFLLSFATVIIVAALVVSSVEFNLLQRLGRRVLNTTTQVRVVVSLFTSLDLKINTSNLEVV